MAFQILAINPGSTSTKIAWFTDEKEEWRETVRHDPQALAAFPSVADQFAFRLSTIEQAASSHGSPLDSLSAAAGRGGLVEPVPGGTYEVDDVLLKRLRMGKPWGESLQTPSVARAASPPISLTPWPWTR